MSLRARLLREIPEFPGETEPRWSPRLVSNPLKRTPDGYEDRPELRAYLEKAAAEMKDDADETILALRGYTP